MVRKMTLAGVLALLPVAACSNEIDDSTLEAKSEQVETDVAETEEKVEKAMAETSIGPVMGESLSVSSLLDSQGQPLELSGLVGERGGVIVFSRSAAWCPFCQRQMVALKDAAPALSEMGLKLSVVTYDSVKDLSQFASENGIDYQLVSDTESSTIIANNLLNDEVEQGTRFYGIPHPAVVVIAANGEVRNVHVDTDYRVRPNNDDVIALAADVEGG